MKQLIARTLILACCTAYVSPFGAAPAGGPSCCECTEPAPTACLLDPVLDTDVDCHWQKTNLLASRSPLGQPTSGPNPNPNPDPNPNPNPNLNPGPDLNPLAQPTSGAHAHARRMRAALRGTWLGCGGEACP